MRLTKRVGSFVYVNTEAIPRSNCKGEYAFSPCQFMRTCKSVGERECPILQIMDKLAEYEDKEQTAVDIKTEVAREIFAEIEQIIQEKLKSLSIFEEDEDDFYEGERYALEKLLAELKNKYIKDGVGE